MQAQFITIIGRAGDRNSSSLTAFSDQFSIFNFDLPFPVLDLTTQNSSVARRKLDEPPASSPAFDMDFFYQLSS